ncbi:SCO family protein [Sphingomonas sp. CL5.1]|uniref:SCO family protein n=1 Tax=Sphingomonas sp. CL5.1 TaxID=2653203 RepID=UPI001C2E7543|nr:SCO family protein [Sphingomonas sp. CL5.1]
MPTDHHPVRRSVARLLAASLMLMLASACARQTGWHNTVVTGLPTLAFDMTRANDGKPVTAADYRGKVTLLYFGYASCPDICPMTLANVGQVLRRIGGDASAVRVLFATVDPDRDTLPVLRQYVAAFGPQVDGLRGDPDALAALARRYRVAYSVRPGPDYEVTHSSGIYVFDRGGAARLLVSSLSTQDADVKGAAADLRRLVESNG